MRIQLVTIAALALSTVLGAASQPIGVSGAGGTGPVVPALQQQPTTAPSGAASQFPGVTPSPAAPTVTAPSAPNAASQSSTTFPSPVSGTVQDQAATAADQAVLAQVQQQVSNLRVVVPGGGAWAPVSFNVVNGVVTMGGAVQSTAVQQQLESLIKSTPGVVAVVNQTTVPSQTESTTTATSSTPSTTAVSGAAVAAGAAAGAAAATAPGVMLSPADQSLITRVRQAVVPQIQVANLPVPVRFTANQGVVTINGVVTSVAQKRQIAALVQQVPGVAQVTDLTIVNPRGILPPATTAVVSPGAGVQSNVGITTAPINNNLTPTGRTNGVASP